MYIQKPFGNVFINEGGKMKPDSDYVKRLVDKGKVVITSATEHTPSGKRWTVRPLATGLWEW